MTLSIDWLREVLTVPVLTMARLAACLVVAPFFSNQFITLGDIHNLGAGVPDAPQLSGATAIAAGDERVYSTVWRNNNLWVALYLDTGEEVAFSISTKRAPIRVICTSQPRFARYEEAS